MVDSQDTSFARLVSLAAHDLRTPLATIHGFAATIQRTQELEEPLGRYVEMISAAAAQMTELLTLVGIVARIEAGRYDPVRAAADSLALATAAAERVGGARAEGKGATLQTDAEAVELALAGFVSCAQRHGRAVDVVLAVADTELSIAPIGDAGPVIIGAELKDLPAAVGVRIVRALGGDVALEDDALRVSLA